jgi:hypothetical protein
MTSLKLTYRLLLAGLLVLGVAAGLAFGLGVAYGRGDPKVVDTGLSAQEIQSLLGGGGGTQGTGSGGSGNFRNGAAGLGGAALANGTTGQITAIDGNTITVSGFQGDVKIVLNPDATVNTLTAGSTTDLKVGDEINAAGATQDDGSFHATAVNQLPSGFGALGAGRAGGGAAARGTPTPTPAP